MAKTTKVTIIKSGNPVANAQIVTSLFQTELTADANGVLQAELDDTFATMVDLKITDPSDGITVISWLALKAGGEYTINMG